jgi:hypothetical protein
LNFGELNLDYLQSYHCWKQKDAFACAVGKMELTSASLDNKSDESSRSSDYDPNISNDVRKADDAISSMLHPIQFPLLNKLGVETDGMHQFVQEALKLHGNQEICFTRGNNHAGLLVVLPSH